MIENSVMILVGPRLAYFRNKMTPEMTQEDFALALGYKSGSSMISQIEGGTAGMSIDKAVKAAKILNVHPGALLCDKSLSNDEIELLSDFLTLLCGKERKNFDAIATLIKASK